MESSISDLAFCAIYNIPSAVAALLYSLLCIVAGGLLILKICTDNHYMIDLCSACLF
jgi:hypothetical protein